MNLAYKQRNAEDNYLLFKLSAFESVFYNSLTMLHTHRGIHKGTEILEAIRHLLKNVILFFLNCFSFHEKLHKCVLTHILQQSYMKRQLYYRYCTFSWLSPEEFLLCSLVTMMAGKSLLTWHNDELAPQQTGHGRLGGNTRNKQHLFCS